MDSCSVSITSQLHLWSLKPRSESACLSRGKAQWNGLYFKARNLHFSKSTKLLNSKILLYFLSFSVFSGFYSSFDRYPQLEKHVAKSSDRVTPIMCVTLHLTYKVQFFNPINFLGPINQFLKIWQHRHMNFSN